MKYIGGLQNGGYHICDICNNMLIMGDTTPYDIDKVADRGRD